MKDLLKTLNPEQRKAVETLMGPVLVLAGPGTGKTHLLTTRIAHLLSSDVGANPDNILCLTFTENGAVEMKDRLRRWIGKEAYAIKISTFHGFCEWVMNQYYDHFYDIRGDRVVADDLQKALAFQETVQSRSWEHLSTRWNDFYYKNSFLSLISHLKRENISPQDYRNRIPEEQERLESDPSNFYSRAMGDYKKGDFKPTKRIEIDRKINLMHETVAFWEVYETVLAQHGFFDFDDQLMWVVSALKTNEHVKLDLQERFQWILVDEYQDTNTAQNSILWSLTDYDQSPNIFTVGDDDQAIFRFQGASVENIFEFQNRFPTRSNITLTQNYRSAQCILDVAFSSIKNNEQRVDPHKSLISSGENVHYAGKITKSEFETRYMELGFIVDRIQNALQEGVQPNDIAVLVRNNREVKEVAHALPLFGIPVAAQVFQNVFDHDFVQILIGMLQIFSNPTHNDKLMQILHAPFFPIEKEVLIRLMLDFDKQKKQDPDTALISFLLEQGEQYPSLQETIDVLITFRKEYWHCRPEVLTEKLLYESGMGSYLSTLRSERTISAWQNIRKFLDWIREQRCETLDDLLHRIELHQELGISLSPDPLPLDSRSVRIMTAHKSKGLEFDIVFLPGMLDGVWGNTRSRSGLPIPHVFASESNENEDERRLFFVALTRAKKELFLSYAHTDFSGKQKTPSLFLDEIPDEKVVYTSQEEQEGALQKKLPVFLSSHADTPQLLPSEKDILAPIVQSFVWSATSLQTFLECPRKFLYQNLYRFPRRPLPTMAYGTALHQALERYIRLWHQSGIKPTKEVLLQQFERALRGQNLEHDLFLKLKADGLSALDQYFEKRQESLSADAMTEFDFGPFVPTIDGIRITGKVDKLLFLDSNRTQVKIVDYKSGMPKAIQQGGRYWRQLVFYDLLARSAKGFSWTVSSCELDFLTPDKNGKFSQRSLQVTDEDRAQVIAELKDAHEHLQRFEFPLRDPNNDEDILFWQSFGITSFVPNE